VFFLQSRGDITVLPAVTALQLHHNAMDTGIDCSVLVRVEGTFFFACCNKISLISQCYGYRDFRQFC